VGKPSFGRPFTPVCLLFAASVGSEHTVLVGGVDAVHVWRVDAAAGAAEDAEVISLGKLRRTIVNMEVREEKTLHQSI